MQAFKTSDLNRWDSRLYNESVTNDVPGKRKNVYSRRKDGRVKFPACLAGVFLAVAVSLPAQAQPGGRERAWGAEQQQRGFRQDGESQRRQQERAAAEQGRQGRLTAEERQQLRRDIREHGRDVYGDRPRRQ